MKHYRVLVDHLINRTKRERQMESHGCVLHSVCWKYSWRVVNLSLVGRHVKKNTGMDQRICHILDDGSNSSILQFTLRTSWCTLEWQPCFLLVIINSNIDAVHAIQCEPGAVFKGLSNSDLFPFYFLFLRTVLWSWQYPLHMWSPPLLWFLAHCFLLNQWVWNLKARELISDVRMMLTNNVKNNPQRQGVFVLFVVFFSSQRMGLNVWKSSVNSWVVPLLLKLPLEHDQGVDQHLAMQEIDADGRH